MFGDYFFGAGCNKALIYTKSREEFTERIAKILRMMGVSAFSLTSTSGILFSNMPEGLLAAYNDKKFMDDYYGSGKNPPPLYIEYGFKASYAVEFECDKGAFEFLVMTQTAEAEEFRDKIEPYHTKLELLAELIVEVGNDKFDYLF